MNKLILLLIKALVELLQKKNIPEQYVYQQDPSRLCDIVTSFLHYVIQDRVTRPTGTICSVNARVLYIILLSGNVFYIRYRQQ